MSRPLRLGFSGAFYHVRSRGNAKQKIYTYESDFELFLNVLDNVCLQYHWTIGVYCLMNNHYPEALDGNLSKGALIKRYFYAIY